MSADIYDRDISRGTRYEAQVAEVMEDGEWYTINEIHGSLLDFDAEAETQDATNALRGVAIHPPQGKAIMIQTFRTRPNRYRLAMLAIAAVPDLKKVICDFAEKAEVLLKELDGWGHQHQYQQSPADLLAIAFKLRRLLKALHQASTA